MDIKPPPRRVKVPQRIEQLPPPKIEEITPDYEKTGETTADIPKRRRSWSRITALSVLGFLLVALLGCVSWYYWALSPKDSGDHTQVRIVIQPGDGSQSIASHLKDLGLIRSATAFRIYTEITGTKSKLQAGGYALSPALSVRDIADHIARGKTDEFTVTILPGLTLEELRPYFRDSGYGDEEINDAYGATYSHPLLADKPQGTSLEGYIFPDTYRMNAHDTLDKLFIKSFDNLQQRLQKNNLFAGFQAAGLTTFQAITLASIVQKEVSNPDDQRQVAQVFLKRLHENMALGSDVTFYYAAKQLGVKPSVNLDSPYNTRKYSGLPPGPIANMNLSALSAVANPAPGDFLFFVAGDGADAGKTFYARTEAEHQANVAAHCHELCR